MDAFTSFELEALRRREVVASDRDVTWRRTMAATESVEPCSNRSMICGTVSIPERL